MTHGRKINDDELVEISGGADGITEVEMDQITDSTGPGSTHRDEPTPGGSPDIEAENSSGGAQDVGPGN